MNSVRDVQFRYNFVYLNLWEVYFAFNLLNGYQKLVMLCYGIQKFV